MSLVITIDGLDALQKTYDPARFERALDTIVDRAAETLRDHTKRLPPVSAARTGYSAKGIPVDTGRLRQSIQKRKTQLLAAEVGAYVRYAGHVHDGTSRVPPRPFLLWSLELGGLRRIEEVVQAALSRLFGAQ
jgi:hypothetical protein